MDPEIPLGEPFQFSEENVERLKQKYSIEMRDDSDNPIKNFLRLIYSAVIEKSSDRRSEISFELSKLLVQPNGVINLFLSLIDFDTSSQIVTTLNQRYAAVATMITRLPKCCLPHDQYCEIISRQLIPLICSKELSYRTLACMIMKEMATSPKSKNLDIDRIILKSVLTILQDPKGFSSSLKPIEALGILCNLNQVYFPVQILVDSFPSIFYAFINWETNHFLVSKSQLKSLVLRILDGLKPGAACCLLDSTLFHNDKIDCAWKEVISSEIINLTKNAAKEIELDDKRVDALISLLKDCNNEALILEFFFHFQEAMWTAKDVRTRDLSLSLIQPLLEQTIKEEGSKLNLFDTIVKNSSTSVELISRTLLNHVIYIRSNDGHEDDLESKSRFVEKSMVSCINILEVIIATNRHNVAPETWNSLKNVLDGLHLLLSEKGETQTETFKSLDSLLEMITHDLREEIIDDEDIREKSETEFRGLVKDLNDKIVPVRVHALVRFKQMILCNDHYVKSRLPDVYAMVESFLFDQEPYVFLACINLILEIALRDTQVILLKLKDIYLRRELEIQVRINVGEVMVRLVKQLNETTPAYAQQVFSILFEGCRDGDELMQTSALVNIGEVCRHLGHSLSKYIVQILALVEDAIQSESINVRCATIDLLRTTLSGQDKTKVESIERELKSIYRILKRTRSRTLDDNLCLQLDLALDEIGRLAREFLSAPDLTDIADNPSEVNGVSLPKGIIKLK